MEQRWWNSTDLIVEQWNNHGGTVEHLLVEDLMVEKWNNHGETVEHLLVKLWNV